MSISYYAPATSAPPGAAGNAMCEQIRTSCDDVFPGFNSLSVLRVDADGSQSPWAGYALAENCGPGNYVCDNQYSTPCPLGRRMRRYANATFTMPTKAQDATLDRFIFSWIWNDQQVNQTVIRGEPR